VIGSGSNLIGDPNASVSSGDRDTFAFVHGEGWSAKSRRWNNPSRHDTEAE